MSCWTAALKFWNRVTQMKLISPYVVNFLSSCLYSNRKFHVNFSHTFNMQLRTSFIHHSYNGCVQCVHLLMKTGNEWIELRFAVVDYCKFTIKFVPKKTLRSKNESNRWIARLTCLLPLNDCVKMRVSQVLFVECCNMQRSLHPIILSLITKVFCLILIFRLMFSLQITVLYDSHEMLNFTMHIF